MVKRTLNPNKIISLLSKLKSQTPDYPSDLLNARKAALINHISIKIDGPGKGGGDGGSLSAGSGGSGALGGMSTAQAILLQAVIGVWIIAAMLTASYVFRDEIINLLQDFEIVPVEVSQVPSLDLPAPPIDSPTVEAPTPGAPPTDVPPPATVVPDASFEGEPAPEESVPEDQSSSEDPADSRGDQGLHLGQTPGAPDTPNQDKPDKPEKPDKSENPNKPDKKK